MSTRHRQAAPLGGKAKLAKDDRRGDRRRERHAGRQQIKQDMESVGASSASRHKDTPKLERASASGDAAPKKFRHWKDISWKRRKNERHRRNEILERAQRDGLPLNLDDDEPTTPPAGFKVVEIPERRSAPRRGEVSSDTLDSVQV